MSNEPRSDSIPAQHEITEELVRQRLRDPESVIFMSRLASPYLDPDIKPAQERDDRRRA